MQQQHIGHYQELRGGPFLIRYTDENGNECYYVLHWATLCEGVEKALQEARAFPDDPTKNSTALKMSVENGIEQCKAT